MNKWKISFQRTDAVLALFSDRTAEAWRLYLQFVKAGIHQEPRPEAEPDLDGLALAKSNFTKYFGEITSGINEMSAFLGRKAKPSEVEPLNTVWYCREACHRKLI